MSDQETLAVYARAAADYAKGFARSKDTDQEEDYTAFTERLAEGARVLDLGCGPGHWAARLLDDGYQAEALDASAEMADHARAAYGLEVAVGPFEALDAMGQYDGIWANFSLLHVPRAGFPAELARVKRALKPGGIFSIGMKLGDGEARDSLGRFYAYYGEDELRQLLTKAGFTVSRSRKGNGEGLAGGEETFVVMTAHG
ncbi:class I SAM-dependent methyltransferase [Phaeobacter sp. QD34_3]|uniref:class I SAM-dependent methyltransferase n=1 Tax=unclassified Phaeobacter TaxID=2621772 RepID=UPI00237F5403|nr:MULTISPECIES: class I SAM-dependent methyltransferase [unclassified Phaeobacter]MDE4132932.1 class I SAM-dependent methyltransferase [Phaeobacter sp. QD34_3]MDE4136666.1 class I SAM-dependent methyltransferase [Phaeobacter sp. QD34_24]